MQDNAEQGVLCMLRKLCTRGAVHLLLNVLVMLQLQISDRRRKYQVYCCDALQEHLQKTRSQRALNTNKSCLYTVERNLQQLLKSLCGSQLKRLFLEIAESVESDSTV
jgi:hypothetical protein